MAGLLDALTGGSGPSLNIVPLDPGTQNLINNQVSNSNISNSQMADKMNAGVKAAGGQASQTDSQAAARSAQTGENGTGLQAIRNQYNKVAGDAVGGVIRNNQNNAAIQKSQWQQQAARSAVAQQQVQTQNYQMMTTAMNQADMARAQVLSSVLGVGGMAAGMAMARPGRAPAQPRGNSMAGGYGDTMSRSGGGQDEFNV